MHTGGNELSEPAYGTRFLTELWIFLQEQVQYNRFMSPRALREHIKTIEEKYAAALQEPTEALDLQESSSGSACVYHRCNFQEIKWEDAHPIVQHRSWIYQFVGCSFLFYICFTRIWTLHEVHKPWYSCSLEIEKSTFDEVHQWASAYNEFYLLYDSQTTSMRGYSFGGLEKI